MPFDDATPVLVTRLDKLKRLRLLLERQTDKDQHSFCSCLFHAASADAALTNAGFVGRTDGMGIHDKVLNAADAFFGFIYGWNGYWMWNADSVNQKLRYLDAEIDAEDLRYYAA